MKTAPDTSSGNSSPIKARNLIGRLAACAVLFLTAVSAYASSVFTWSGAAGTYVLGDTNNWGSVTNSGLPVVGRPSSVQWDTMLFDGTVAGALTVTNGPGNGAVLDGGGGAAKGLCIRVAGTQTSPLTFVQSNGFTGVIRFNSTNMLVVESGAGAVTLGDGSAEDLRINVNGTGGNSIHQFTNNSAYTVTINTNVHFVTGGGGTHTLLFAGTNNWQFNTRVRSQNAGSGSTLALTVAGPCTVGLVGAAPNIALGGSAGGITVNGGTLRFDSDFALQSGPTLTLNGGSLDSSVPNLVLTPGLNAQTWGGDFAFIGTQDLNLGAGVVTMAANRTVTVSAGTLTVDGTVSGAGRLTKSGAGTLYLSSTMSYTGGTIISNGVLRLNTFPGGTSVAENLSVFGGTLDVNGNSFLVSALNGTGGSIDTLSGGTPTLTVGDFNASGSFSGTIQNTAGSLSLVKTGIGSLTLGGASTYSGNTTVSAGTLLVTNTTGSGTGSGDVTVSSGATFGGTGIVSGKVDWQTGSFASFIQGSPLTVSTNVTLNNNIVTVNIPGVAPLGAGTYTLMIYTNTGSVGSFAPGSPTFTGAGVAAGSAVSVATGSGLVQLVVLPPPGLSATWTNDADANWSVAANWDPNQAPVLASEVATLGVSSAFRTVTLDIAATNGFISFNNSNSFAIANAGNTLTLDNTNGGAAIIVVNGSSNSIAAPVSLADSVAVSAFPGASVVISGVISGTSSSRVLSIDSGSGTVVLSGNNTYGPSAGSVGTTIKGSGTSTLQLGNNNALGAGDVSMFRNATILAGTALTMANNVMVSNDVTATVDLNGNNVTLSGVISGGGALVKNGAGTLTLSGANSFTNGFTVNAGTVNLGNVGAIPGGLGFGGVTLSTNTLLDLKGFSPVLNGLGANAGSASAVVDNSSGGNITLTLGTSGSFSTYYGSIKNSSGVLSLVKDGAGNQTLAGTNTYTGGTTISNGLLRVGIGETNKPNTLGTGPVTNYGTLEFNMAGTHVFTNTITGNGALNLANSNLVLRLYGDNSAFTGNILVNMGSLRITNANALGTGPKNVTATGAGSSQLTELRLDGSLGSITLPANIDLVLSWGLGVGALINDGGTNSVLGNIITPYGGGNAYVRVNSGFLTLAGNVMSDGIAGGRTLQLGGTGNGLYSGSAGDLGSNGTVQVLGGITKSDAGTWTVSGNNTSAGTLNVNAGTLILSGSWSNGPAVINTGGTLAGTGIASNLTVNAGGRFVPGDFGSIGTFAVTNIMNWSGMMYVSLNRSAGQMSSYVNVLATGATNLVANTGSSLIVSNLGPALVAGDSFTLFSQPVTNGNLVVITNGFTLASGLVLSNYLAVDGSIKVVQTINTNAGVLQFSVSGSALTLGWPTNLGWTLQAQTNSLSVGLRNNWVDVPGSTAVTQSVITINPANPTVFYRLKF